MAECCLAAGSSTPVCSLLCCGSHCSVIYTFTSILQRDNKCGGQGLPSQHSTSRYRDLLAGPMGKCVSGPQQVPWGQ
jgi:hypothetical protein